jgi:uncharacterized coiled-coil DUF342 family protein
MIDWSASVLKNLKGYIEEVIEYSEEIDGIKDEIYRNSQTADDNHRYAMEHIQEEFDTIESDIQDDFDSFQNQIDELKQMIEELQK